MATATAITRGRTRVRGAVRPAEFRAALEEALAAAQADERIGPSICATGLRLRLEFPDLPMVLNVAAGGARQELRWAFTDEVDWRPKLELSMDAAVANRYLQGRESLAIAIARGQVRYRGEARAALLYLPATRLLCEPYRRVVRTRYPDLSLG